jgi:hypothetical protein
MVADRRVIVERQNRSGSWFATPLRPGRRKLEEGPWSVFFPSQDGIGGAESAGDAFSSTSSILHNRTK